MDFALSEEQSQTVALAQQILAKEAAVEHLKVLEASGTRYDSVLWQQLAESGLVGACLGEAHGGMGFGFETLCLLAQEVGATVAPLPLLPCLVSAMALEQVAGAATAEAILPAVAKGETLLTVALNEPGNDDPAQPSTCLEEVDGQLRLHGTKHLVPYAAQAPRQ